MHNLKLITTNTKKCSKCYELKDIIFFGKAPHHADNLKSQCKKCEAKWHAENYKKSDKVKDRNKLWKKNNPEYAKTRQKRDMQENPLKYRNWRLKRLFGLSLEQYNEMFAAQNGCCAICSRHQSQMKQTLCVDHNHTTGKIRKLLCGPCNHALGLLREDINIAQALIDYLKKDKE